MTFDAEGESQDMEGPGAAPTENTALTQVPVQVTNAKTKAKTKVRSSTSTKTKAKVVPGAAELRRRKNTESAMRSRLRERKLLADLDAEIAVLSKQQAHLLAVVYDLEAASTPLLFPPPSEIPWP